MKFLVRKLKKIDLNILKEYFIGNSIKNFDSITIKSLRKIMWCDIYIQIIANLISSIFIALIFFLLSDYVFKIPNMSGYWNFTTETLKSTFKGYEKMTMTYTALIWMDGKNINGTGEKIHENSIHKGIIEHTGEKRSQVKISGYIEKRYLSHDRIIIHLTEKGEIRESSAIQFLRLEGKLVSGNFISTAADSEGKVHWTRKV